MSTTSSTNTPIDETNRIFIKTRITINTLICIITPILFILLIWHISTSYVIERFGVPPDWQEHFVRQQRDGLKTVLWVVVFLLIFFDFLYALLCLGWWHKRLKTTQKAKESKGGLGRLYHSRGSVGMQQALHDDETRTSIVLEPRGSTNDIHDFLSSPPPRSSYAPNLLSYLPLTIYDALAILVLSLHISTFFANIGPSRHFCNPIFLSKYAEWELQHQETATQKGNNQKPQIGLQERCKRINWSIHTAGGWTSGVCAVLAFLHFLCVVVRIVEYGMVLWRKRRQPAQSGNGEREEEWDNPPRDVDVRTRSRFPRSSRMSRVGSTLHPATISEEERTTGLRQRDSRNRKVERGEAEKPETETETETERKSEHRRWDEALLDLLLP